MIATGSNNSRSNNTNCGNDDQQQQQQQELLILDKQRPKPTTAGTSIDIPEQESSERNRRLLLYVGLVANVLLLVGGTMFVIFFAREIRSFCSRDTLADVLYWTGFTTFLSSGVLELLVDTLHVRTHQHGRYYTNSANRTMNITISVLFIVASAIDVISFMFWRQVQIRQEQTAQWIASHLWLITSIIVLGVAVLESKKSNNRSNNALPSSSSFDSSAKTFDTVGNVCFFVESCMVCIARYITIGNYDAFNLPEFRIELCGSVFWVCSAIAYIIGDIHRFHSYNNGDNPQQQQQQQQ